MAGDLDLVELRRLVGTLVANLSGYSHRDLGGVCQRLGMPVPAEDGSTKRERLDRGFAAVPDADLPMVAGRILRHEPVDPTTRNAIEDVLWAGQSPPEIPTRTRREIARDLDLAELVQHAGSRFKDLLGRLWVLNDDPFGWPTDTDASLSARIDRHVFRNPGDWSAEELFEQLKAFEAGDARFIKLLEGLVSADVIPDEPVQRRIVNVINPHLHAAGVELRETGIEGGYPVFSLVSVQSARSRRPKNLIFATLAKPDIRFVDAIDNDIEIVGNEKDVLVYDRPITGDGILWRDLQAWWKDTRSLPTDTEAKTSLYNRLGESLPKNSRAQQNLFTLYHQIHGRAVHGLPALLPEVWLHWDPKTVRARGADALLRFRMDFLLLLTRGQRVVLEVDGSQHYTTPDGRPDSAKYAASMRGDRDLKLAGYEVFRFGADELNDREQARILLQQFFTDLFQRFGVAPRPD